MIRVKLNRDWKGYKAGDILTTQDRPAYTLQFLLNKQWAEDLSSDELEIPTMKNTKKEIELYLDENEIEYSEYQTKAELLELCHT